MAKNSIVRLPNGVIIEITNDFKPDQINAIITSVMSGQEFKSNISSENKKIIYTRSAEHIWSSSKREKLALFIRTYFSSTVWIIAKDVLEEQLNIARFILFGETSQIGTYMKRLSDDGFLYRRKIGKNVEYQITPKLLDEYPEISTDEMNEMVINSI